MRRCLSRLDRNYRCLQQSKIYTTARNSKFQNERKFTRYAGMAVFSTIVCDRLIVLFWIYKCVLCRQVEQHFLVHGRSVSMKKWYIEELKVSFIERRLGVTCGKLILSEIGKRDYMKKQLISQSMPSLAPICTNIWTQICLVIIWRVAHTRDDLEYHQLHVEGTYKADSTLYLCKKYSRHSSYDAEIKLHRF